MRKLFQLVALVIVAALGAVAQSTSPKVADGQTAPVALPSPRNRTNLLTGSLSVSNVYDDNVGSDNTHRLGDFTWFLQPTLTLQENRRRLRLSLSYSPTFTFAQRFTTRDLFAHNFGLDVQYRTTPHSTLRVRDSFRVETNLLDRLSQDAVLPNFSVLDQPNDLIVTPFARRIYHEAGLDLTYLTGPYSVVGISASFSQTRLRSLPDQPTAGQSLVDSQSEGGRAFYAQRISRHHSIGAMYQFMYLNFLRDEASASTQTLFYTHSIDLSPSMSLSLFVGPQFSRIRNQLLVDLNLFPLVARLTFNVRAAVWSYSSGATWEWTGKRTALRATWARRVSDGAGLFGASRVQGTNVEVRRQLKPRLTAGLGFGYSTTTALGLSSPIIAYRVVSASGSISYVLAEHLVWDLRYARLHQAGYGTSPVNGLGDHDQFSISLSYQFTRPLGR